MKFYVVLKLNMCLRFTLVHEGQFIVQAPWYKHHVTSTMLHVFVGRRYGVEYL